MLGHGLHEACKPLPLGRIEGTNGFVRHAPRHSRNRPANLASAVRQCNHDPEYLLHFAIGVAGSRLGPVFPLRSKSQRP